jgi:hypothetical protein
MRVVHFDARDKVEDYEPLIPVLEFYNQQYEHLGFFPHRPYGVAISPEGWIYISTGGGKIYVLRPV